MNKILSEISKDQKNIEEWRHQIHKYPELSYKEVNTAAYVADLLKGWGYDVVENVGKTGVVASMTVGDGKKSIGLRADLDALPITEQTDCDYKSCNVGVMHACGHDGHTAMLLGGAKYLAETKNFNGTVRLIFQPAEELLTGAQCMVDDGFFDRFPIDVAFGMHNMPILEEGMFFFTPGPMMASSDTWIIELKGVGGHGSTPEHSIDPIVAGASLVMSLQSVVSRNVPAQSAAVVTVGAFNSGDAANVIPDVATIKLNIRCLADDVRTLVLNRIEEIVKAQVALFGVSYSIDKGTPGAVLNNDESQTDFARKVAIKLFGEEKISKEKLQVMGSEDFSVFSQSRPSNYCFIGNGDTPFVHNPKYWFNDRNLTIGAAYWTGLTEEYLK